MNDQPFRRKAGIVLNNIGCIPAGCTPYLFPVKFILPFFGQLVSKYLYYRQFILIINFQRINNCIGHMHPNAMGINVESIKRNISKNREY